MQRNLLMFFLFCCTTLATAFGQNITVTGTVIDENDEPVIGATIRLKSDESKGTVTDIDGHFTIQTASGETLLVSYVGYKTQEVKATKSLTIKLVPDQETLDEVMVVAYGTAKKESLTGSIAVVDAEDLNKRIQGNAIGSLEGAASGVQVNNTYGEPGKAPKIRIRGIGTLGTSSPLYVVDGVPYSGDLSEINPSDIKSFSILKDAASTALYGSRASNGVVLITTKNGSAIKNDPTITFTSNIGAYTRGLPEYDRLDPAKWMEASWIALKNFAINGEQKLSAKDAATYATQHLIADYAKRNIFDKADDQLFDEKGKFLGKLLPGYDDLDWAKAFEKVGLRQDYNISGSYATDKMSIYSSLGYLKEEGYVIASDYERFTARANGTYTPVKWLKLGTNVNASYTNRNYNSSASEALYMNPFYNARYKAPIYPYYMHKADGSYELDENGEKVWDTTSPYLSNRNIGYELRNDIENAKMRSLGIQGYADIILPYGFTATVRGDMNERVENYMSFNNPNIGDGAANNGRFREGSTSYSTYTFQQLLNWKNTFADRHNIEVLLGHENYSYKMSDFYGMNENMAIGGIIVMKNFLQNNYFEGFDDNYRTESYFSRLKYDYDNRYIVEGSFRRDGSSRFAPDKRWGNFFSIGGSWNISSEEFMQDVDWVDFLKLRASYGEVGNDASIGYYGYMALYTIDKNGGEAALIKKSLPTPDIKWETSQTVDVALEGRLWDRLDFSLGYFDKRSLDLLFEVPLPLSAGSFPFQDSNPNLTMNKNIGTISNSGIELSLNFDIFNTRDFSWSIGTEGTFVKNKVIALPDGKDILRGVQQVSEGHSIYEYYTYNYEGVDQLTGRSLYTADPDKIEDAKDDNAYVKIGDKEYVYKNSYAKKVWSGSALPTYYGSLNTNLNWKGFGINALFTYSLGGKMYDSAYASLMSTASASSASANHVDILDSWMSAPKGMKENDPNRINPTGIPAIDFSRSTDNNAQSNRWLVSSSYLTFKNLGISYSLPKSWVNAIELSEVTFSFGAENLFTLTARKGLNPQFDFAGGSDDTYVTARVYNFGLNLKF